MWAESSQRNVAYALCEDRRSLLWFANQRAVEFHPTLVTAEHRNRSSQLVLDIDPPEGAPFARAVGAARLVEQALADVGLSAAVKTSGAKGLHVVVPLEEAAVDATAAATRAVAARAERLDPTTVTTAFIREDREGKGDELDSVGPSDFTLRTVTAIDTDPWVELLPGACAASSR